MSHQKHLSHQQRSAPAASRLAKLWVSLTALAVAAAGLAAMAVSQPATAQISPLDPALCATTYKPTSGAGTRTEDRLPHHRCLAQRGGERSQICHRSKSPYGSVGHWDLH